MSITNKQTAHRRHPWLKEFENAPAEAFGDLLAGYANIHPYDRADPPDAARMVFGPLDAEDPARVALGPAIVSWLEVHRKEPIPAARSRRQRRIREICEALEIVALLRVADAAVDLHRRYIFWQDWVARLVLSPARDARAEYWRTLALTQPLVREQSPENDPRRLAPLWQRICREAGGRLEPYYLKVGLLGLRRLPETAGGSEVPWVSGLAQWALAQEPSESAFMAEWLALKALYPRSPQRWHKLVTTLLSAPVFEGIEPPAWWGADPDFAPVAEKTSKRSGEMLRSPLPRDCDRVIKAFAKPFTIVEPKINALLQGHQRYLDATGDSQYFVRAIHALGSALVSGTGDKPHDRARKAQFLARAGLRWEPYDRYLWSLWRDALAAEGNLEAAELVGWEFVRRDPANPDARNQLAGLLGEMPERRSEAMAILKETIELFPENVYARTQLAELLIAEDQFAEAWQIVDSAFDAGVANAAASFALRARLCANEGGLEEARAAVESGLSREPSNLVLLAFQKLLATGEPLPLKSKAFLGDAPPAEPPAATGPLWEPELEEVMRRGAMRRLRFRLEGADAGARANAIEDLRRALNQDPTFAYAELLAARHRIWEQDSESLPVFATAFEQALAAEDRQKLEELALGKPRLEALTLVARAVLGDAEAAELVEAWLRTQPAPHEEVAVKTLREGLRPVLAVIKNGRSVAAAFLEHRETVTATLHDSNETVVGNPLLAA